MTSSKHPSCALITGASSGIGLELARIHAQKGGSLILVARRQDRLESARAEFSEKYGTDVTIIAEDLTDREAGNRIFEQVKDKNIDILINNAGFGLVGRFDELDLDRMLAMIDLNVTALTQLSRLFLPAMVARGSGKLVNISSVASLVPGPMQAVYFASKAYVTSLTNALSEELRGTGVSVTNVMPGATKTEFGEISGMDKTSLFDHAASVEEVAQITYQAMEKGKRDTFAGVPIPLRMLFKTVPFVPKGFTLRQVASRQQKREK